MYKCQQAIHTMAKAYDSESRLQKCTMKLQLTYDSV
jgi:hypothetical protein